MKNSEALLQVLRDADDAQGISELAARLPTLPRRTLQRLLRDLVSQGMVLREGQGPATRYHPAASRRRADFALAVDREDGAGSSLLRPQVGSEEGELGRAGGTEDAALPSPFRGIPLAPDAEEVLALVLRPQAERSPVGYQREWLEEYVPGESSLLSPTTLRRLSALSDTGHRERPAGTWGRSILQRLLIDLSWASSHLEGNTYTRLDTRELIEHGREAEGRASIETQMILNHKSAIEYLVENVEELDLSQRTLREIHALLAENLLPDPMNEGRLRQIAVDITGSVYRPLEDPWQLRECYALLVERAAAIPNALEQSFFLLVHLPYLQPFADVNKRTARLAANLPLLRRNLCPLTFVDVPPRAYNLAMLGVYELTRPELLRDLLLWAYERSASDYVVLRQSLAEPNPLRLRYRTLLRRIVPEVVRAPEVDPQDGIHRFIEAEVPPDDREALVDLVMDELRRLHEGTLARYGLRLAEWERWRAR